MEDYHFLPPKCKLLPLALVALHDYNYYFNIKIASPNPEHAMEYIRETYRKLNPRNEEPEIHFMDESIDRLYEKERKLSAQISFFSLVSGLLAIIGVFGIIHFEMRYRRKEIAIRKVFGATVGEILRMFNKTYIRIVLACFVIAVPIAYYFMREWLKQFCLQNPAARMDIHHGTDRRVGRRHYGHLAPLLQNRNGQPGRFDPKRVIPNIRNN